MHDAATATASATGAAELAVSGLNAWYGESHVLHGMEFEVRRGEVVTLLGRNGAGKTTTMKAVMGMIPDRKGSIRFGGTELIGMPSNKIARLGLAFCPEERGIFKSEEHTSELQSLMRISYAVFCLKKKK